VDLSALENFQPRPVNAFSVARNINKIPDLKREYRYFLKKYRFKVGPLPGPPGPHLTDRRVVAFRGVLLDVFVTFYSIWIGQGPLFKYSLLIKRQQSQALANRKCEVGKFQKAVTPKVFEFRSPYQKTCDQLLYLYPWIL
jgi:hypothetical protein